MDPLIGGLSKDEWMRVGWALEIPLGWKLTPAGEDSRWILTMAGPEPMNCGHRSMQVTAKSLPMAVARMSRRVDFHRRHCR